MRDIEREEGVRELLKHLEVAIGKDEVVEYESSVGREGHIDEAEVVNDLGSVGHAP